MMEWLATDRVMEAGWQALVLVLLRSTLLLGVLMVVMHRFRDATAVVRARVLSMGLLALLVLPLLTFWLPVLALPVAEVPRVLFQAPAWSAAAAGASSGTAVPARGWLGTMAALPLVSVASAIWFAGAAVLLLRFAVQSARIRTIATRADTCAGPCAAALDAARRRMGIRQHIRVAWTERTDTPVMFGWNRPTILLPREARGWSPARLEAVLCHELAHVARMDYVWLVVAEVIHAIYWPNPLVRRARNALRLEQDKACDGAAVQAGVPATDYAATLLALARSSPRMQPRAALPLLSAGRTSPLRTRIRALLERRTADPDKKPTRTRAALAVLLASVVFLAAAEPWQCTGGALPPVIELPGITVY
jgi:beta-lactamase regulating signal transducer with metallopeptidase domain